MTLTRRQFVRVGCLSLPGLFSLSAMGASDGAADAQADVCVYGGTASGIMAVVAAAREGCSVIVVEPSRWLGGMTGGGLSAVDWGRKEAVGGATLGILQHGYDDVQYRKTFDELVNRHGIEVLHEYRLNAVQRNEKTIQSITLDYAPPDPTGCPIPMAEKSNALTIRARIFIDCSYEGDLMAKSGVSYTYGRESREHYAESLAGVRPNLWVYDIDPYIVAGDPQSGLLPLLQKHEIGSLGAADNLTMGYCFRYKFDVSGNGIAIEPTPNYDPNQFELFRRGFQKGLDLSRSRKMRTLGEISEDSGYLFKVGQGNTNRSMLTTTVFGCNTDYPDSDWAARSKIWKFHQDYLRDLVHFLRTDATVPDTLRTLAMNTTFQRSVFDETGGWPHQLYVREARRMVSTYVVTQHDLEGTRTPQNSVGLASYGVDDWPYATVADQGHVALSGGEFSILYLNESNRGIYQIPYQAIVPKHEECDNLLTPVCCSASHIAMTSLRMEPVWMILGESAGVASAMAVHNKSSVQDVPYDALRTKLLELGQQLNIPAA